MRRQTLVRRCPANTCSRMDDMETNLPICQGNTFQDLKSRSYFSLFFLRKMMLLWVLLIQATSACFITDCPHGMGKRSEGLTLHQGPRKYPQVSPFLMIVNPIVSLIFLVPNLWSSPFANRTRCL